MQRDKCPHAHGYMTMCMWKLCQFYLDIWSFATKLHSHINIHALACGYTACDSASPLSHDLTVSLTVQSFNYAISVTLFQPSRKLNFADLAASAAPFKFTYAVSIHP